MALNQVIVFEKTLEKQTKFGSLKGDQVSFGVITLIFGGFNESISIFYY